MFKMRSLLDAWNFVINSYKEELNLDYIKKVYFEICKGQGEYPLGDFRNTEVGITGTNWMYKVLII